MNAAAVLSAAQRHLSYDRCTGTFVWLTTSRKNPSRAGRPAGHVVNAGYLYIQLTGFNDMPASRLAWLMEHGEFPAQRLNYVDGDTLNYAIGNLELPRPSLNALSPSQARARVLELLAFDADTGIFTARADRLEWAAGELVGTVSGRYIVIGIDGNRFLAHRLAWLVVHGVWPKFNIDHIDGNGLNNRPVNLRDVTQAVNMQNQRRAHSNSKTGLLGVHQRSDTGKFVAQIKVPGVPVRLGEFDVADDAHQAYLAAKRVHHEGCTI